MIYWGDFLEQVILEHAQNFANNSFFLSYILMFINSSLQALFPPYPGDTIIVLEGYIASLGVFSNFLIVFSTLAGTVICNVLLFLMCYKYGDKIISHMFFVKYFNVEKVNGLKRVFNKYGAPLIIFNRFVPGLAMITVIAAGIFRINKTKAIVSASIAGIVHNILLMSLGYTVGYNLPLIKEILIKFNKIFIILAIILFIVFTLIYYVKSKKTKNKVEN